MCALLYANDGNINFKRGAEKKQERKKTKKKQYTDELLTVIYVWKRNVKKIH